MKMKMKTKNIGAFLLMLSVVFTATSCLKDDPIVKWPDKNYIVEIADADHTITRNNVGIGGSEEFKEILMNQCAIYASHIAASFDVQLATKDALIATYNTNNGLDGSTAAKDPYVAMPAANYTLPTVTIDKGNREKYFDITVSTAGLAPGGKYIVPVVISSVPAPYIISGNFGYVNLLINVRAIYFNAVNQEMRPRIIGSTATFSLAAHTLFNVTNSMANVTVAVAEDPTLIAEYNTANGLDGTVGKMPYVQMPAATYTLPANLTFAATGNPLATAISAVTVNTSGFTSGEKYIIPLIITGTSSTNTGIHPTRSHLYMLLDMP